VELLGVGGLFVVVWVALAVVSVRKGNDGWVVGALIARSIANNRAYSLDPPVQACPVHTEADGILSPEQGFSRCGCGRRTA